LAQRIAEREGIKVKPITSPNRDVAKELEAAALEVGVTGIFRMRLGEPNTVGSELSELCAPRPGGGDPTRLVPETRHHRAPRAGSS
jgi:hypothetical protein